METEVGFSQESKLHGLVRAPVLTFHLLSGVDTAGPEFSGLKGVPQEVATAAEAPPNCRAAWGLEGPGLPCRPSSAQGWGLSPRPGGPGSSLAWPGGRWLLTSSKISWNDQLQPLNVSSHAWAERSWPQLVTAGQGLWHRHSSPSLTSAPGSPF